MLRQTELQEPISEEHSGPTHDEWVKYSNESKWLYPTKNLTNESKGLLQSIDQLLQMGIDTINQLLLTNKQKTTKIEFLTVIAACAKSEVKFNFKIGNENFFLMHRMVKKLLIEQ